ncbi:hypothetical protein H0H93_007647 [Arthromyces matolae]|nr:hypothetical protein H0H93_007647 [Arthromyces matolae]
MSKTIQHADQEAEVTYSKAAKAELSRDYDVAFRLYVKAAELYLNLSRTHSDDGQLQTAKWKANAGKALQRAEKIKAFVDKRKSVHQPGATPFAKTGDIPATLTPVGINHFSPEEQSFVLKKGDLVNGLLFPLWDQPVSKITQRPFEDPDGQPKLSSEQAKELPVWRRVPPIRSFHTKHRIHPQQILQHIVTDCSVFVDDRLPYHPVDGTLMCLSVLPPKNDPTADPPLWPSILEKGYMKLMGGYDFPGSNSSIDLHAIAGWIPEHIEIKSSSFEREKTWQRINEGFARGRIVSNLAARALLNALYFHIGDCVLTIGTGTNARITLGEVELLSSHSYAVIGR